MRRRSLAFVATFAASLGAGSGYAQESAETPTAEQMIAIERETWRSADLRPNCPEPTADEIVVCAREPDEPRLESPTDAAIRMGERPPGMPSNAAHLFDPPPCIPSLLSLCSKFGPTPARPALVDLTTLPEPLSAEDAALVFRAEDLPGEPASSAAASPEAAR